MAYRRKSPRAQDLPFAQQLHKFCNAGVGCVSFEPHYAKHLMTHLQESKSLQNFSVAASLQKMVPARLITKKEVKEGVTPIELPLPKYFIDSSESPDDFEPRAFYHMQDLVTEKEFDKTCFPRCGMSGLFFCREEIMDNLAAAAQDLHFSSPFWIKEDYEPLRSGYLSLKDDSDAIVVSITSSVAGSDLVQRIAAPLLHPLLRKYVSPQSVLNVKAIGDDVPLGMNAISGFVSRNPHIQALPNRGLWVSYDQLLHMEEDKEMDKYTDTFLLVEVDQWSLYNADQLTVPGRLGLKRKPATKANSIFTPL
eukprot:gene4177-3016_t